MEGFVFFSPVITRVAIECTSSLDLQQATYNGSTWGYLNPKVTNCDDQALPQLPEHTLCAQHLSPALAVEVGWVTFGPVSPSQPNSPYGIVMEIHVLDTFATLTYL